MQTLCTCVHYRSAINVAYQMIRCKCDICKVINMVWIINMHTLLLLVAMLTYKITHNLNKTFTTSWISLKENSMALKAVGRRWLYIFRHDWHVITASVSKINVVMFLFLNGNWRQVPLSSSSRHLSPV